MYERIIFVSCILIILASSVMASDYYADIDIFVKENGLVIITGETNHPDILTEGTPQYTSMKAGYWLLNITIDDTFSAFIYTLHLPQYSSVNYLKTRHLSRIDDNEDGVDIIGTGKNENFVVMTQYTIGRRKETALSIVLFSGVILAILLAVWVLIFRKRTRAQRRYNPATLTEREQLIITILEKSKRPVTQACIERETKLPKSSLSRNINALVRKGILTKEPKGMSNIIWFSE